MTPRKQPGFIPLILGVIIAMTAYNTFQFYQCISPPGECIFAEDFGLFYHAAQQAVAHDIRGIYNTQQALNWLGAPPHTTVQFHPFLYPPQSVLLLYPLGLLCEFAALLLWCVLPIVLLIFSLQTAYIRQLLSTQPGDASRQNTLLFVLFLPFVVFSILAGQNGVLWAALFILVLAERKSHPVIAGLLLAIFSCKPQLGILLPLLLLVEKNWLTLLTAIVSTLCMIAVSLNLWGIGIWQEYQSLMALSWQIISQAPEKYLSVSASPYMALRMVGISSHIAIILQGLICATVVVITGFILTRCKDESLIVLLLITATFLVLPYAWIYDSTILALACALLLRREAVGVATSLERMTLVVLAFIPIVAIKLQPAHIPYSTLCMTLGFIVALSLAKRNAVT